MLPSYSKLTDILIEYQLLKREYNMRFYLLIYSCIIINIETVLGSPLYSITSQKYTELVQYVTEARHLQLVGI